MKIHSKEFRVREGDEVSLDRRPTRAEPVYQAILERIDQPEKNWKFGAADVKERGFWKHYMSAYEACLGATSTNEVPWYIVPADDKENARLIVSRILLDTLDGLNVEYPVSSSERRDELVTIQTELAE